MTERVETGIVGLILYGKERKYRIDWDKTIQLHSSR